MSLEDAGSAGGGPSADDPLQFEVLEHQSGQRLDVFLSECLPQVSRVHVKRGIDAKNTTVDGTVRKASFRVSAGQHVEFRLPPPVATGPEPEPIELSILFEDEALAVIDKPPGMVVHPAKGHWSGTLASALVHHFDQLSESGGPSRPGIVHRLDRDTSGVMVVAKTDAAHQLLAAQFKNREVSKQYLAIVTGRPDRDRDRVSQPIGAHPSQREKMAIRADHETSRAAETFYEVQERYQGFALIQAKPKTGRTHQIRLHLLHIGCPVLCDRLYAGRAQITLAELRQISRTKNLAEDLSDDTVLLNRQALHAQRLSFSHPLSGERVEFSADLPPDLQQTLLLLRQTTESR